MEDDHLPFVQRGVPSADLIDLDYGYGNVFHHTPQDTLDKLSAKSMEIVGSVILETVRLLDQEVNRSLVVELQSLAVWSLAFGKIFRLCYCCVDWPTTQGPGANDQRPTTKDQRPLFALFLLFISNSASCDDFAFFFADAASMCCFRSGSRRSSYY